MSLWMVRPAALLIPFALTACGHVDALTLKNSTTGEMRAACGPYTGLTGAVAEAQKECAAAWAGQGWTPTP